MNKLTKKNKVAAGIVLGSMIFGFSGLTAAFAAGSTVGLGSADSFAVLGFSGVTASTPSVVSGDVGLSPAAGTLYSGLTTGMVTGTIYAVDATGPAGGAGNNPSLLTSATGDLATAFTNAGQAPSGVNSGVVTGDLGTFNGGTLTPGVYQDNGAPNSLSITGTLTLDGGGDPNAVFIFRSASTLTTASNSHVTLTGGTQACNVFWQIGSSATLGTSSDFKGTILAAVSITDNGGSTVVGRFLAQGGAVTLDNTHLTKPTCTSLPLVNSSGSASYWSTMPLINIVKVPNPLALPGGPGPVTYTYTVTNTGENPLSAVWVNDDKCAAVSYVSGDTNTDSALQKTETWTYRCTKTVLNTETNIATAHGFSNSMEMYANATATVTVGSSTPISFVTPPPSVITPPIVVGTVLGTSIGFPDTGFPPRDTSILWGLIALSSILLTPLFYYFGQGMFHAQPRR